MVGMISCVVLVLHGCKPGHGKETLLKLFSGAAPDKFSLCKMAHLLKSRQTALRGRRI
jgi:hypothetical protein